MSDLAVENREIVIVATPTHNVLRPLLHELSHQPKLYITVLTRETSISLALKSHSHNHDHDHNHNHSSYDKSTFAHVTTNFTPASLQNHLQGKDTVICVFSGSDLHLSSVVVDAAVTAGVKQFIPSEYGLDTTSSKVRELLPPYEARYEVQNQLKKDQRMRWRAIYAGIMLEDGLKTDGVLGIDVQWGSVAVFPGAENLKVAISTYEDVAKTIVASIHDVERNGETQVYSSTFTATLDDLVQVIETELDNKFDRYEADPEAAKKEASERMKMGYFDGGIALMGRVAVWGTGSDTWKEWEENKNSNDWKDILARTATMIRSGDIGGDGCGC